MKVIAVSSITVSCLLLASCQTSNTYMKVADGPDMEYSLAKCEIASASTQQGMWAMGSPAYVFGAQLGNAIDNEIRKQEFVKRCMIMHGWKQVPANGAQAKNEPKAVYPQGYKVKPAAAYYGSSYSSRPPRTVVAGQ